MKVIRLSYKRATVVFAVVCVTVAGTFWSPTNVFGSDAAAPADLSPVLQDVVKLAQAHLGDDVILAYIKNSGASYTLSANDIVYLKGQGVSQNVISLLLQKGSTATPAAPANTASAPPPPPPAPQPESPAPSAAPTETAPPAAAAPTEVGSAEPMTAPAPAPAPEPVVNLDYFQQELSPYGAWVNVPEYGVCWQPYGIPYGWRPYYDNGYWVYTDAGLYWQSEYSWGAIRFIMAAGRMWKVTGGSGRRVTYTGPRGSFGVIRGIMSAGHHYHAGPYLWMGAGHGMAIDMRQTSISGSVRRSSSLSATGICGTMIIATTRCAATSYIMSFGRAWSMGFIVMTMADSSTKDWTASTWNI